MYKQWKPEGFFQFEIINLKVYSVDISVVRVETDAQDEVFDPQTGSWKVYS